MKYLILLFFIAPVLVLSSIACPDGSSCADDETCCSLQEGGYGCCPFANAVCCSDDLCCPWGSVCIISSRACLGVVPGSNGSQLSLTPGLPKKRASPPRVPKSIPCPGRPYGSCPDNTTCCPTGCCLEPKAVCCSDGKHCCPGGFTCDVKRQKCVMYGVHKKRIYKKKMIEIDIPKSLKVMPLHPAFSASAELEHVVCPGGEHYCADNNTCCLSSSAVWKCCPLSHASCCKDGEHCCPARTTCSKGGQSCSFTSESKPTL